MRLMKSMSLCGLLLLIVSLSGAAAETPRAVKPEDVGISSQRLHDPDIHAWIYDGL